MTAPALMRATPTNLPRDVAAATLTARGLWKAELKLDGIRACATINGDTVKLTNRNGVTITHRYPDVVQELAALGIDAVLDGEIIVYGPDGKPSFRMAHRRDAQDDPRKAAQLAQTVKAKFIAFDILSLWGNDLRPLPYDSRRARLDKLKDHGLEVNPASDDGPAMWAFVESQRLEGLVLKRRDSRYTGRRDPAWVKVKRVHQLSALVNGFDRGKGHRAATFGALHLVLVGEGNELVPIGSVGSGFTNADCKRIRDLLDSNDHPIIVEVQYLEVTSDGKLRDPSFKGVRTDVSVTACTVEQLHDT